MYTFDLFYMPRLSQIFVSRIIAILCANETEGIASKVYGVCPR